MKIRYILFLTFVILSSVSQTFALDPKNVSIDMTYSSPEFLNTSGQPRQQFERGETVSIRLNMHNGGPEGLSARIVLNIKDASGSIIYDNNPGYLVSNWGTNQQISVTLLFTIPQTAALGQCKILGSVRDGRNGGWDIVYDTTGPSVGQEDWSENAWL
ncbi:MAG: hypothetical protein V2A57_00265, partial [Elusimicrobiota bacterium]